MILWFYFSLLFLVFDYVTNYLEVYQKYPAVHHIFNYSCIFLVSGNGAQHCLSSLILLLLISAFNTCNTFTYFVSSGL